MISVCSLRAQDFARYPVSVTIFQSQPSISPFVSRWSNPSTLPWTVNITLNDLEAGSREVELKIKIKGSGINLETPDNFAPSPISIFSDQPGMMVSAVDLAGYFESMSLTSGNLGTGTADLDGMKLPEGWYELSIQVFDVIRAGTALSSEFKTFVFLQEHEPPLITLPQEPTWGTAQQSLIVQWMPQHLGSFPVNYTVRLYEMVPGLTADQVLQYEAPIGYAERIMGQVHIFDLTGNVINLQAGQSYMLVVGVAAVNGDQVFKNEGWSAPLIFEYESSNPPGPDQPIDPPLMILPLGMQKYAQGDELPFTWQHEAQDTLPGILYHLYVSRADNPGQILFDQVVPQLELPLAYGSVPFEEEVLYRTWVVAFSDNPNYEFANEGLSNALEFELNSEILCQPIEEEVALSCDAPGAPVSIDGVGLLTSLAVGSRFYAGEFLVEVTESSGTNPFGGTGVIKMPYFQQAQVNVELNNVKINENCQMIEGSVDVVGAGVKLLNDDILAMLDEVFEILDEIDEVLEDAEEIIGEIQEVLEVIEEILTTSEELDGYFSGDINLVTRGTEGIQEEYPYLPEDVVDDLQEAIDCLKDPSQDMEACKQQLTEALQGLEEALKNLYNASLQIEFVQNEGQAYGFDQKEHDAHAENYDEVEIAGAPYTIAWKSVRSQLTDLVNAQTTDGTPIPDNIRFETNLKVEVPATDVANNQKELTLTGTTHEHVSQIYAVEEQEGDSIKLAGKLNVISYDEIELNVVLVPVNGATITYDISSITDKLNAAYNQAVVTANAELHPGITVPDFDNEMDDRSTGLADYTAEMRKVRSAFKNSNTVDQNTHYLFLIQSHKTNSDIGFMPKKEQFGFLYLDNIGSEDLFAKTIAHEVGHGAYVLEHSFETYEALSRGSTENLMDYGTGMFLRKYQWDLIHNPAGNVGLFDGDDEGESHTINSISQLEQFKNSNGTYSFVSPAGRIITLPNDITEVSFNTGDNIIVKSDECYDGFDLFPFGTLQTFVWQGTQYKTFIACNSAGFTRYAASGGGAENTYFDILSKELTEEDQYVIVGFPCVDNGRDIFKIGQIEKDDFVSDAINNEDYRASGDLEEFELLIDYNIVNGQEVFAQPKPEISEDASNFLSLVSNSVECSSSALFYAYAHAHQITIYPELFNYCESLLTEGLSFEEMKQIVFKVYENQQRYVMTPGGGAIPVEPRSEEEILTNLEINSWKEKEASVYKKFKDFITDAGSEEYILGLPLSEEGAKDVLALFEFWADYPCSFAQITPQSRLHLLELLQYADLKGKYFGGLFGEEEENIYNYLLSTASGDEYQDILALFEKNNYELFRVIMDKMNDSWLNSSDKNGFEFFISILSKMIMEAWPSQGTYELTSNPTIGPYGSCTENRLAVNQPGSDASQTLTVPIMDPNVDNVSTYYRNNYDEESSGIYVVTLSTLGCQFLDLDGYNTGKPFWYTALEFKEDTEFSFGGQILSVKAGETIVLPFIFAELIFRKYKDADLNFKVRIALDVLAILTVPLSGGASLALRVLTAADAIYAVADMFIFAPTSYQIETTGSGDIRNEIVQIWDNVGLGLGVLTIGGLIVEAGPSLVIKLSNIKNTYRHIRSTAPDKVGDFKLGLQQLMNKLQELAQTATNPAAYERIINHLKAEIATLNIHESLTDLRASFSFHLKQNFWAVIVHSNIEYAIGSGEFLENYYRLRPLNWVSDLPGNPTWPGPNYQLITAIDDLDYVDKLGGLGNDKLEFYQRIDGTDPQIYTRIARVVEDLLAAEFPDFRELFRQKGWSWDAHFTEDVASTIRSLSQNQRGDLLSTCGNMPSSGNINLGGVSGERLFGDFLLDLNDPRFKEDVFEIIDGFKLWEKLHSADVARVYRLRLKELYNSAGKPNIVLKYGQDSEMLTPKKTQDFYKDVKGKVAEKFNWNGNEISEDLAIIIDPSNGELRFRFYNYIAKGTKYERGVNSPVNNSTTREIIPATPGVDNPSTLNPSEILLAQKNISNRTGDAGENYFVLKNVYQYLSNELELSVFDKKAIKVFRNLDDGQIWTLDHRRLVFFKLGNVDNVKVEWADPQTVLAEAYKMSTKAEDAGRSCGINMYFTKPTDGSHRKFFDDRLKEKGQKLIYEKWRFGRRCNKSFRSEW